MYISMDIIEPLLAVVAGVLALISPRNSAYILGLYLIVVGTLGLLPHL